MEQLYKDKLARSQSFLQDMADAQAWWSGGAEGPSRPLAERARTRAAQEKDLEELARGIATTKVGLGQLQQAREGIGAGGTSAPTMGGGAPTMSKLPPGWNLIDGVPYPPETVASYLKYINIGDITRANAVLAEYAKTNAGMLANPTMFEQKPFWTGKKEEPRMPYDVRNETLFGRTPPAPAGAPTPTPAVSSAPAPSAASQVADVYRFENLSAPQQARLKTEFANLNLQGTVEDLFNRSPMEKRKAAFEASGETSVAKPTQATPSTTQPEKFVASRPTEFASPSEQKAFSAREETRMVEEEKPAAKAAGERRAALENLRPDINNKISQATTILNILDETPKAIGLSYRGPATGTAIEAFKEGLIPFMGKKNIEGVVAAASLSPKERENRRMFDTLATAIANEVRRDMAKGTGSVSNYETSQFEKASGLNVEAPANVNRYFAVFFAETIRAKARLLEELDTFMTTNPKANFSDFERTKTYERIQKEWNDRLQIHFPQLKGKELAFGPMTATQTKPNVGVATSEELDSWKKRYGGSKK